MIVNVETRVNVIFGVLKDEEIVQKIPVAIEINWNKDSFEKALNEIMKTKADLEKQLKAQEDANSIGDI